MYQIDVNVEVVYRKRRGRTMHVDITADKEGKSGRLMVDKADDGSIQLQADTSECDGTAWITLSAFNARTLVNELASKLGLFVRDFQ